LILKSIYENENLKNILIFKGGTLLAKGYFDFFRMSEDLDFSVDNSFCKNRTERRKIAETLRNVLDSVLKDLNFREVSPFRGFNESTQYNAIFGYDSVSGPSNIIKFEIGFRGDMMLKPINFGLQTLLESPLFQKRLFPIIESLVLCKEEAFAEKMRAALTRRQPAIRDFFDVEKIFSSGFNMFDESFMKLVKDKLSFDSSSTIDLNLEKRKILESQIATELKSVLKSNEIFNIDNTWKILKIFVDKMSIIS
jgi:predicted nucleotidyltransferase component of viral defense system